MTQYYAPITEHQERVEKFMKLAGQELPDRPTLPNEEVRLLRAKLILEEALETIEALGMSVCVTYKDGLTFGPTIEKHNICFIPNKTANLEEIIDGCCDISVVTIGTLSACGVPDQPFLEEVDENNLAKFGPGGYRREDGKWVKPPDHTPPKIKEVLKAINDLNRTMDQIDNKEPFSETVQM